MATSEKSINLLLFNKPFQVMCQFTDDQGRKNLGDYIQLPNFYAAGRLDYDSEGLILLTNNGILQHRIANPTNKMPKTYWVQVEGNISSEALAQLQQGVVLKDGPTRPAKAKAISPPTLPERNPPVRKRQSIPTSWIELTITEGKNRQVRRMTAAVGFPTLRLVRIAIGNWKLEGIEQGQYKKDSVHLPRSNTRKTSVSKSSPRKK